MGEYKIENSALVNMCVMIMTTLHLHSRILMSYENKNTIETTYAKSGEITHLFAQNNVVM